MSDKDEARPNTVERAGADAGTNNDIDAILAQSSENCNSGELEHWTLFPAESYPFPVACLPDCIGRYVQQTAAQIQVPESMAATISLSVIATAAQGRYKVQIDPSHEEPVNIYALCVALPSERKSPIFRVLTSPLEHWEREQNRQQVQAAAQAESDKTVRAKVRKQLERDVAKAAAKSADNAKKLQEELQAAIQAEQEAIQGTPCPVKLISDDCTPESLAVIMSENHGRAAVLSSEGGILDMLAGGMYSKTPNLTAFLKAWSGDSIKVDRITRKQPPIYNPSLTMCLCCQPSVMDSFLGNQKFGGTGLVARFLVCNPTSLVGKRFKGAVQPAFPGNYYLAYSRTLTNLLNDREADPEGEVMLKLSDDALEAWTGYYNQIERDLDEDGGKYSTPLLLQEWAGKLAGTAARIAGLLHVAAAGTVEDTNKRLARTAEPVTAAEMRAALQIADYYLDTAENLFRRMPDADGEQPALTELDIDYVVARMRTWFKRHGDAVCMTRRDFTREIARGWDAARKDSVLEQLAERGIVEVSTTGGRGRGRTLIYFFPDAAHL